METKKTQHKDGRESLFGYIYSSKMPIVKAKEALKQEKKKRYDYPDPTSRGS